jgi:hypothetical protein
MTEFDCIGCGRSIVRFVDLGPDEVCGTCMTLGAQRSKLFQNWQDGVISEAEFRRAFSGPPPQYICRHCGMASWHPSDGLHGWCGACHLYKADTGPARRTEEQADAT